MFDDEIAPCGTFAVGAGVVLSVPLTAPLTGHTGRAPEGTSKPANEEADSSKPANEEADTSKPANEEPTGVTGYSVHRKTN